MTTEGLCRRPPRGRLLAIDRHIVGRAVGSVPEVAQRYAVSATTVYTCRAHAKGLAVAARRRAAPAPPRAPDDPEALTPWRRHEGIWVKRDDLFVFAGVPGGKVRTCLALARAAHAGGCRLLVTAGSRASPQVNIVAHEGRALGMSVRCHTPAGTLAPEVLAAQAAGAEIIQHKAGYNSVIIARAKEDARARGGAEIPFGMECQEAIRQTAKQVAQWPRGVRRLVAPVGSGMSLAGILHGLLRAGMWGRVRVLGVVVGADPSRRLDAYAPLGWAQYVDLEPAGIDYHARAPATRLGKLELDAHYEAKCLPFLRPHDALWVVGIRATAVGTV